MMVVDKEIQIQDVIPKPNRHFYDLLNHVYCKGKGVTKKSNSPPYILLTSVLGKDGATALHLAAVFGHLQVTRCLIEQGGINPLAKTLQGKTPYDMTEEREYWQYKEIMKYLKEFMSESILTKISQLSRNDFKDLVALGTYVSYENRVYLAGPCNIGKSSLPSILIDDVIPKTWFSTNGLIIHFGRNGIDLLHRKMIPLKKGSGDVLTKLLLGNPEIKEEQRLTSVSTKKQKEDDEPVRVKNVPSSDPKENERLDQLDMDQFSPNEQPSATSEKTLSVGHQQKSSKPDLETLQGFQEPPIHTAHSIQDDLSVKDLKHIAPSDLVDFGGQKSFDMTHQLFIQHRGTFILMFDGRIGLNTKLEEYKQGDVTAASILEHWINSVLTYCTKSEDKMPRIVFAATHSDSFSEICLTCKTFNHLFLIQIYKNIITYINAMTKDNKYDEKREKALKFQLELADMFSSHKLREHIMYHKVFFINATDASDLDIDRLKNTLVDIAFMQSTWGQKIPIVWVPLDLQISDMRADGVKFLTKEKLLEMNKSNKEFPLSEKRVEVFLLVQHSIGKLLYFDEPALRDFIVIQPTAMINILRAFITDSIFWPEQGPIRNILENLSSTGVLKKTDLFSLWSQPAFKDILTDVKTKEYVVQVLLHLDILIEPKRYTENDTAADIFLVPCMVKKKIPKTMQQNATDDRTICIAYHLKETVVPSALSYKLIGASISIWPLKVVEYRFCLYIQAAIMDADNRNELQIRVEGQRIIVCLINHVSKQLISPDLATNTQECLSLALGRILQFYHRCFGKEDHQVTSDLFEIEVGEICKGETCLIPLSDAKEKTHWICKNGKKHAMKCPLNWIFDKNQEHCHPNCKGLEKDTTLDLKPNDQHFVNLAKKIGIGDFYNFFIHLGMSKADYDNLNFRYFSNPMDMMLMGMFQWRAKTESDQSPATFGKLLQALTAIERKHFLCQVHREDHSFVEKAHRRLHDIPSVEVINTLTEKKLIGDCVVHLGIELGLSIVDIRETMYNFPRDLNGQIHDLLIKWKKTDSVKRTIYWLMVVLKRVEADEGLAFLKKTYDVE
ncbi:unnamed protein product [Mytilus coruscus]|uniref:Death domain-containing protein n=1 Tax=Mytilus coruscus TaxID=42192 RepID=A0A6J8E1W0_MYTCO|nr:unnamed protein product [Mytilus coruscus]